MHTNIAVLLRMGNYPRLFLQNINLRHRIGLLAGKNMRFNLSGARSAPPHLVEQGKLTSIYVECRIDSMHPYKWYRVYILLTRYRRKLTSFNNLSADFPQ